MGKKRRKVEIAVISDVHLGTYGCRAKELNHYLQSIKPDKLILNGDIIDFWQFSKRYWPKSHMKVLKSILNLASKGTMVYYITGNHDETLRKFAGIHVGNISVINQLELVLNGQRTWFFHGDVFDVIMKHSKWLAKLGAIGYDSLVAVNVLINSVRRLFGKGRVSISKRIKQNVKTAVKYIGKFEETAALMALRKNFNAIVCGHIHYPEITTIHIPKSGQISYLNSGDWVENMSALEYDQGRWVIYRYEHHNVEEEYTDDNTIDRSELIEMETREIFEMMVNEFSS